MKWRYVIKREYTENIRKRSFIISTILAPVLLLVVYSIPILAIVFVPAEQVRLAVLDRTGELANPFVASLKDTLRDGRVKYVPAIYQPSAGDFDTIREELLEAVKIGGVDVLIEIPEDVLETGKVNYISKDLFNERTMDEIRDRLNPVVINQRFAEEGIDYERVEALTERVRLSANKTTSSGVLEDEQVLGDFILVVVFVMILYMTLLSWGMSVQRSIIEEKSSRVIEVMLSSVEPRDLFIGKILGVGSLGLTQILIWGLMILAFGFTSTLTTVKVMKFIQVSPVDIVYFALFFVLGFLFYSSFFTIIGAVCNTEQDAQQLQTLVVLPLIVPVLLMFLVAQNPNATVSVVLSFIPFFTPMLMLARIVVSEPSVWEILISVLILLLALYGVTIFAARVFRVGILMYGKRPNIKEIVRWFRYA